MNKTEWKLVSMSKEEREIENKETLERTRKLWQEAVTETQKTFDDSKNQLNQAARDLVYIFEETVEENLIQPTFIIDYPKSISPLSKASPENPQIAERFELFINGMEVRQRVFANSTIRMNNTSVSATRCANAKRATMKRW